MIQIFLKGGPIMWPLLFTAVLAIGVVMERLSFTVRENARRDPGAVERIFSDLEAGEHERAVAASRESRDYVARVLSYALRHRELSHAIALTRAANRELNRFRRGLSILDTVITLSPLLGLLGTVTGMIRSFSLLGGQELGAPMAITGGIAEALIATAFGLLIAIIALIPFNFLNARMEEARRQIEDAASRMEVIMTKPEMIPQLRER